MPESGNAEGEGFAPFREHRTWYRITGALREGCPPLVILHGGPGAAHNYVDRFKLLASPERAVIHYDQIGCGRSTHLPKFGAEFWTVELFLEELDNLLAYLGISGCYDLLGQSWGGMLAAEHAVRQPAGLRALIVANSPASMVTWVEEANRLRAKLPPDTQKTLIEHEKAGTTDSVEYQDAVQTFYNRHLCRISPWPDELIHSFDQLAIDPTVYHTMNGPSEFHVIGSLKTWSIEARLNRITVPTLVISGKYDEATERAVRPYVELIPAATWGFFENSSHTPHIEETEKCMDMIARFLEDPHEYLTSGNRA